MRTLATVLFLLASVCGNAAELTAEQHGWLNHYVQRSLHERLGKIRRVYQEQRKAGPVRELPRNDLTNFEVAYLAGFTDYDNGRVGFEAGRMGLLESDSMPRVFQALSPKSALCYFRWMHEVAGAWNLREELVLIRGADFSRATDGKPLVIDSIVWLPGETYQYSTLAGSKTISVVEPLELTEQQHERFLLSSHQLTLDTSPDPIIGVPIGVRGKVCEALDAAGKVQHVRLTKVSPKCRQAIEAYLDGFSKLD